MAPELLPYQSQLVGRICQLINRQDRELGKRAN